MPKKNPAVRLKIILDARVFSFGFSHTCGRNLFYGISLSPHNPHLLFSLFIQVQMPRETWPRPQHLSLRAQLLPWQPETWQLHQTVLFFSRPLTAWGNISHPGRLILPRPWWHTGVMESFLPLTSHPATSVFLPNSEPVLSSSPQHKHSVLSLLSSKTASSVSLQTGLKFSCKDWLLPFLQWTTSSWHNGSRAHSLSTNHVDTCVCSTVFWYYLCNLSAAKLSDPLLVYWIQLLNMC